MMDRGRPLTGRRAMSQAVTRAATASVAEVLSYATNGFGTHARLIGITGAPGAGKSTLVGRLAAHRVREARTLAIIAIDPSSPRTQGSVLGDRIRMETLGEDPRIFIRSLPSGRSHDGLTHNLPEVLATLEEHGFDEIVVETVGVGQTEYGVRALVDVEVLVLTPGAGDYVQAMKAGIVETADIVVVNKADLPGADRLEAELAGILKNQAMIPPVVSIRLGDEQGIKHLSDAIDARLTTTCQERDELEVLRMRQCYRIHSLVERRLQETLEALPAEVWDQPTDRLYRKVVGALSLDP